MSKEKEIFEGIYEKSEDPWTKPEPPEELAELVETGKIKPCRAIDIGCGRGYYSIYLASKGFDILGIDLSERAIQYARNNASGQGANTRFMVLDLLNLQQLKEKFDFVLEWGILHHIMPPQRKGYMENLSNLLNRGGRYLSVCFNEQSPEFGEPGKKYRKSPIGTMLYYSSLDELRELFSPQFRIIEAKTITMSGGRGEEGLKHTGNYFFMEKL